MSTAPGRALEKPRATASDSDLVRKCLRGDEEAWNDLIAKYKNLIFSIPIKYRFTQEEATDVFQAVCLDLVYELPRLRDPEAVAGWLIRVAHNKCFHLRRETQRFVPQDGDEFEMAIAAEEIPDNILQKAQQEQRLRRAVAELKPRCQELVRKLFFELPARPYQEVARELGLAIGSIGFIRRRCLDKLRQRLEELGVC